MRKRTKNILLIGVVLAIFTSYLTGTTLFDPSSSDNDETMSDTSFHYLGKYDFLNTEDYYNIIEIVDSTLLNTQVNSLPNNPKHLP